MGHVLDLASAGSCRGCGARGSTLCPTCFSAALPASDPEAMPGVDRVVCAWHYSGAPRSLILDLKLRGLRDRSFPLTQAMLRAVHREGILGETITWVPARRPDVRRRGFDHGRVLATDLGCRLGLPVRALLRRAGRSRDQTGLTRSERAENLVRVFGAVPCTGRVVVVDDLVTTGATVRACSAALRGAGATGVEVIAACQA